MKMKKLLATALVLLMSMMACVLAFAEGWDYTITETIDCTGFTEDKTGSGWEWDHTAKTLKITDNLLIKITQKAGNENYGIKLPGGATLEIQKNLLVGFVAEGENFGTGYGVYSEGEITINGTLRTVREGGDIFAVAAQKVTLGKDAQISAPSCAGVVTPKLVVDGNNTIIADHWCIKNNNNVEITGSGTLTLDCGDKPVDCNGYTVKDSVKLKFIASPVPKERITNTIPASLKSKIQVTHADDEGKMAVSIGEMNSDAWAAAIEEALKDPFSGEISSIGFNININKAKLPTGAVKWMHANGNIISDDQFSEMVLNSNDDIWDKSSSDFFGWNFTLADVTEEGDNYIVTPAKYDDMYIYMAWKDISGNVIRVEKLNVVATTSAGQIKVPKEQVARPVPVGNGQLKFNTNNALHIEESYDESAGLLKYAITDMDAVKAESASKVLKVNTEVSAPDGYDTLTIVDSNGQSPDILPATISVPYADNGELATNEYPFKLIWKDSKDSAKELTQILNIRITVKNATWMDEYWTPVSEDQLTFIPNIADITNNGMPLTLEKGKGDSSKVTRIHAEFNKDLTLQNVLDLNQSYVEIKAPNGIVGYRQNNSGGNDPEGYVEYNNYTALSQDNIIKAAELNNSTTAQFKFVPFSSFVTPEGITVYYAPKQGYVRLIDWYDKEENIVERQYLYFLMEQANFTVETSTVATVSGTPSQPTLKDGTASEKDWALVCQKNPQVGTNAFYVELKVVDGNGKETKEIKEHFEKNGSKAEIFLPFFDYGINPEDAKNGRLKFTLTHYKDGIDKAGTEIKYRLDESGTGIWFSTDSFSPFTVKWETVSGGEKPSGSGSGSGSGSSVWYRGGNSLGASIPFDPTEVLIDGVSVPFTVDGNTITIPSLTDGPHNVKVIWRGGSYSFNITASGTGKSIVALPQTGDSSMGPYVGLCMLVFMGMLAGGAVLNRKKAK